MQLAGVAIFAITYVLISSRRLQWLAFDRPAGALLGAVLCVAAGVLTPSQALGAIDGSTLLLLFGVMGMGAFLAIDGFFDHVEHRVGVLARSRARLLAFLVWGAGILSAFITNDAVCVLGAPLVVRIIQRHQLPPFPFLLALATAANTGSIASLVGNPQNMLCGVLGSLSYGEHLLLMGPVAIVGLAINHAFLHWVFRKELVGPALVTPPATGKFNRRAMTTLVVIVATAIAYTAGAHLAWTATAGFVLLMLIHRRDTSALWSRIDWTILLFFAGLFVVVEGLVKSGAPAAAFRVFPLTTDADPISVMEALRLAGIFLVGSNVVSNVPFILVVRDAIVELPDPRLGWELLAMASTFAGNLTLLGSVANVIVAESGRELGGIPFWKHLRVGLPLTLLTTAAGTLWVVLMH